MARRSVLLLVSLIIAALGTAMIIIYVQGIDARATEGQELVEVLQASEIIEAGESVTDAQAKGKFEIVEVRRDDMVDGALSSVSSLEGQVAIGRIFPQEQILSQKFGSAGSEETLVIPDDLLAVSVELTDPQRVAGFVNPGSQVAMFVSADPMLIKADGSQQNLAPYTRLLLPKVGVIGVGTTSVTSTTTKTDAGDQVTEQVPRTILTVAVTQEQAEKLIYASRNGEVSFALISENSKVIDNPGVTARDIMPEPFKAAQ